MSSRALLAHVVSKFASRQWENVATESLHYLLARPGGASAMKAMLGSLGFAAPDALRWSTQAAASQDTSIPDLVGDDDRQRHAVIVEVKFWASLTPNQPLGYLDRQIGQFPDEPDGHLLLFLVPQRRLHLVVAELATRLGVSPEPSADPPSLIRDGRRVVVVTWARMLAELQVSLERERDDEGLDDLAQLRGLCDRADDEAMLPISAEEVDPGVGRRFYEFCDLANGAADVLTAEGLVDGKGLRSGAGQGYYTRYVRSTTGHIFGVGVYSWSWATKYPSPWWVKFWQPYPGLAEALARLAGDPIVPHQRVDDRGSLELALQPPIGMERDAAVEHLAKALRAICSVLPAGAKEAIDLPEIEQPIADPG